MSELVEYRIMSLWDIDAGLRLCREARWNQTESDWREFFQSDPEGATVAVSNGEVVGTAATIRYQHCFSWIGMVLVDKRYRRQGIGQALLQEALRTLRQEETVKLDATPAGREVYLKLDFVDEFRLSRMSGIIDGSKLTSIHARPIREEYFDAILAFDERVFGARRGWLLRGMYERSPQHGFFIGDRDGIRGYCLGRQGYHFLHIGPLIAEDEEAAKDILSAALPGCQSMRVILDVTHFSGEWMRWLEAIGFSVERPFIRMYRGKNNFPGLPQHQFAILGPEFG